MTKRSAFLGGTSALFLFAIASCGDASNVVSRKALAEYEDSLWWARTRYADSVHQVRQQAEFIGEMLDMQRRTDRAITDNMGGSSCPSWRTDC
jgi:hypothetical protein